MLHLGFSLHISVLVETAHIFGETALQKNKKDSIMADEARVLSRIEEKEKT